MPAIFPARLLPKTFLAAVSKELYVIESQARSIKEQRQSSLLTFLSKPPASSQNHIKHEILRFSVATWLDVLAPIVGNVSLVLVYRDGRGEFAALIEEITATDQTHLMLSGEIEFAIVGALEYVDVYLGGSDDYRVEIEQLCIKRPLVTASVNHA